MLQCDDVLDDVSFESSETTTAHNTIKTIIIIIVPNNIISQI